MRARVAWMDCLDACAGRLEPFGSYLSGARRSLGVGWLVVFLFLLTWEFPHLTFGVILWNHGLPLMFRCMLVVTNKL
jgi:hypothetical protein